jgi:hypothetical protein
MGLLDEVLAQTTANYGNRVDGTAKGNGFFGPLLRPDGSISGELSFGFDYGDKNHLAPLLVPTLNRDEIDHLLGGNPPTREIYDKAIQHAIERMRVGKPLFAAPNEVAILPK